MSSIEEQYAEHTERSVIGGLADFLGLDSDPEPVAPSSRAGLAHSSRVLNDVTTGTVMCNFLQMRHVLDVALCAMARAANPNSVVIKTIRSSQRPVLTEKLDYPTLFNASIASVQGPAVFEHAMLDLLADDLVVPRLLTLFIQSGAVRYVVFPTPCHKRLFRDAKAFCAIADPFGLDKHIGFLEVLNGTKLSKLASRYFVHLKKSNGYTGSVAYSKVERCIAMFPMIQTPPVPMSMPMPMPMPVWAPAPVMVMQ